MKKTNDNGNGNTQVQVEGPAFDTLKSGSSTLCKVTIGTWTTHVYASSAEEAISLSTEKLAEEKEFGPLI